MEALPARHLRREGETGHTSVTHRLIIQPTYQLPLEEYNLYKAEDPDYRNLQFCSSLSLASIRYCNMGVPSFILLIFFKTCFYLLFNLVSTPFLSLICFLILFICFAFRSRWICLFILCGLCIPASARFSSFIYFFCVTIMHYARWLTPPPPFLFSDPPHL